MNIGIITKIEFEVDMIKYYIRLDRNFKLNNKEYNIYIIDNGKEEPTAEIFKVEDEIVTKSKTCVVMLYTKYEFELEFNKVDKNIIIKSIKTIC